MALLRFYFFFVLDLFVLQKSTAQYSLPDEPENDRKPGVIYLNAQKTTAGSPFQRNLETVIQFFLDNNPANGYATCLGYGNPPDRAYGHSACYNMSTQPNCSLCIKQAYDAVQQIAPLSLGATYWINDSASRCRLRYETYSLVPNLAILGVIGPNGSAPAEAPAPQLPTALRSKSRSHGALVWGLVGGAAGFVLLLLFVGCLVWRWRRTYTKVRLDERHRYHQGDHDHELEGSIDGPTVFKYQDLVLATEAFSERNKLGQGGFGVVYKASLKDGTQVAVKKLSLQSKQGKKEFVNEISIITSIQHRNLVRLKGYCVEGDERRLLVYEFLDNGSLDLALFSSKTSASILNWQSRFQIAIGVARGLAYLHEESHVQVIHRDIKASNVLLDDKLQPKISDFGISKLFDDKDLTSTKVAGTLGYMAPEYVTRGRLTPKADVFSYGVLALEIVSGRKCMDPTLPAQEELLVQLVWNLYKAGRMEECVDKKLEGAYIEEEVSRLIRVAMLCTQDEETARPTMSEVVTMLLGYKDIGHELPSQAPLYFVRPGSTTSTSTTASAGHISITELTAR